MTDTTSKEDELLKILEAHGEKFLSSFSLPEQPCTPGRHKRNLEIISELSTDESKSIDEDDDEEWEGIIEHSAANRDEYLDIQPGIKCNFDDNFRAESSSPALTKVVVFTDFPRNSEIANLPSKTIMKTFMSSKISKLRQDIPGPSNSEQTAETDVDDERSNARNDALLHRLVHTELLSASPNTELNLSPAQRRKALAGRVLELSGGARLGNGQKSVTEKERNKAAKRVRVGLIEKQKTRVKQELEEAKSLGNYHPTIKKLFKSSTGPINTKRDRGLKMGVGRFSGGFLKLSQQEVNLAQGGQGERGSNRCRHSGGRRITKR